MAHALRQSASNSLASQLTFATAPLSGSLLIALCTHWSNTPAPGAGWTSLYNLNAASQDGVAAFYKYAGAGESVTQTPFIDGTAQQCIGFEITGVSGVIATDVLSSRGEVDLAAGSSFASTSFNTSADNVMVLAMLTGDVAPATTEQNVSGETGGLTIQQTTLSNAGVARNAAGVGGNLYVATLGTAVLFGWTFPIAQLAGQVVSLELAWDAPAPPSPGGSMLLTGVG